MKKQEIYSVQEWLPFKKVLDNGIIKQDYNTYIKVLKVYPINFNLKSELEKEAILNSYKVFLKTCNFDLQILIQSNKEDLSNIISKINNQKKTENDNVKKIADSYINYINNLNLNKKSSNKNFYILIKNNSQKNNNNEELIIEELNDNYFKIKECLSRCGNIVKEVSNKKDMIQILYSFVNRRVYNSDNQIM